MTQQIFDPKLVRKPEVQRNIKRWLRALRSGKYKQARGNLHKTTNKGEQDGFCCLGVMIDITDRKGWTRAIKLASGRGFSMKHPLAFVGGESMPSDALCNQFGILNQNGARVLAMFNDSPNGTFSTVANMIEKALKEALGS